MTLDMLASRTPMDQGLAKTDMKLDLAVTLREGMHWQRERRLPGHNEQGTEEELSTQTLAETHQ